MKLATFLFAAASVAAISAGLVWLLTPQFTRDVSGPLISWDKTRHSGGVVRDENRRTIVHRFNYRNTGTQPLTIDRIELSCGCTIVNNYQKITAPGREGHIDLQLTLSGAGLRSSDALVYSNSPTSPDRLFISADFRPPAVVTTLPAEINFGEVSLSHLPPQTVQLTILTELNEVVEVQQIQTTNEAVEVHQKSVATESNRNSLGYYSTTLTLEVSPLADVIRNIATADALHRFTDRVTLTFSPSTVPQLVVPISGQIVEDIRATPERLVFVTDESSAHPLPIQRLRISCSGQILLQCTVTDISPLDIIEVQHRESESLSERAEFDVRLLALPDRSPLNGSITFSIQTDQGLVQDIRVPFSIRVLR